MPNSTSALHSAVSWGYAAVQPAPGHSRASQGLYLLGSQPGALRHHVGSAVPCRCRHTTASDVCIMKTERNAYYFLMGLGSSTQPLGRGLLSPHDYIELISLRRWEHSGRRAAASARGVAWTAGEWEAGAGCGGRGAWRGKSFGPAVMSRTSWPEFDAGPLIPALTFTMSFPLNME